MDAGMCWTVWLRAVVLFGRIHPALALLPHLRRAPSERMLQPSLDEEDFAETPFRLDERGWLLETTWPGDQPVWHRTLSAQQDFRRRMERATAPQRNRLIRNAWANHRWVLYGLRAEARRWVPMDDLSDRGEPVRQRGRRAEQGLLPADVDLLDRLKASHPQARGLPRHAIRWLHVYRQIRDPAGCRAMLSAAPGEPELQALRRELSRARARMSGQYLHPYLLADRRMEVGTSTELVSWLLRPPIRSFLVVLGELSGSRSEDVQVVVWEVETAEGTRYVFAPDPLQAEERALERWPTARSIMDINTL